jgi:hypothetical protein
MIDGSTGARKFCLGAPPIDFAASSFASVAGRTLTLEEPSNRSIANWRALCNGKTLAFQARDAGSIPAARSRICFGQITYKAASLSVDYH